MSTWRYTYTRDWPLPTVTHISLISNSFCPEATGHAEVKIHIAPSLDKGTQIYRNSYGHMTKMADGCKVENFNNLFLAGIIEAWYTASGTQVLQGLFK